MQTKKANQKKAGIADVRGVRRCSNKLVVMGKYPFSYAHGWSDQWSIYSGDPYFNNPIGEGKSAKEAWRNAKKNIA